MSRLIYNVVTKEFTEINLTPAELAIIETQRIADFEASWLHKDRPIRAFLLDGDYVALLIDYPEFAMLRQELKIPVEACNGVEYLYFEYLHPEDEALLKYFGGTIEPFSPQP